MFREVIEGIIVEYESQSLYDRQAKRNASIVRKFFSEFSTFSYQTIRRFLFEKKSAGLSNKTLANFKSALSAFGVFLRRAGFIEINPCRDVEIPKIEELPPIILTRSEAADAISIATGLGCVGQVIIAMYSGLRAGEICRLTWADIDVVGKGIIVRKSKGKTFRVVPMCRRVSNMIEKQRQVTGQYTYVFPKTRRNHATGELRLIADAPRSMDYMMEVIAPIRDALPTLRNLPPKQTGRGWHAFRHTFASWAVA
ncbi:MAG: tyrosine-type recombinase/integrase, partial [Phycisphaerae bacterium]|nr:tyrosine-type recombinase/integrase [Phycisphaerae bacterium]